MTKEFYRAFEDRFRGPRELIKSRLQAYLPFLLPLRAFGAPAEVVDLGCGRGEWLELLTEHGFEVQGVDLDDAMLVACRARGLTVHTAEAIVFLRGLPDSSQAVVSGFHIAEHIPFEALEELLRESLRVLRPAGLLILETPNPENLVVGTSTFYLDPTHQNPIPPQTLEFLTEYTGFMRSKILRLQESPELLKNQNITLLDVLNGVSPDYAVVAQKNGPEELVEALTAAFEGEYGITLKTLAERYQQQTIEAVNEWKVLAQQARQELQAAHEANHRYCQLVEEKKCEIEALINSNSWRITAPLRKVRAVMRHLSQQTIKPQIKRLIWHAATFVMKRPRLKRVAVSALEYFPGLKSRLMRAAVTAVVSNSSSKQTNDHYSSTQLTYHARQIHDDLASAIAHCKEEND